jgi:hypothetical protein
MRKIFLAVLFGILMIVIYLTRQQTLGWIRWDGWSLFF